MRIEHTALQDCLHIQPDVHVDERGTFVKTFHRDQFAAHGLATGFAESFHSVSRRGVLRGLHFQLPPHDHVKLVHCTAGRAFDVAVDLRVGSPTEGRWAAFELSAEQNNMLYIPAGFAHGWYALTEGAQLTYQVTTIHAPQHDSGIHWDSAGIRWPDMSPLVSVRDARLLQLCDFHSPFVYKASVDGIPGEVRCVSF